jgi:hypothetical protein
MLYVHAEKRELVSPLNREGQWACWPGRKPTGIANHETNKAIVLRCPNVTRISAIPGSHLLLALRISFPHRRRGHVASIEQHGTYMCSLTYDGIGTIVVATPGIGGILRDHSSRKSCMT